MSSLSHCNLCIAALENEIMVFKSYFEGKRVLVTGAGRGIGKAFVHRLHSYGAEVYAVSRTASTLQELEKECPGVRTVTVDLGDWEGTRKALSHLPPMHFLVNNAGILKPKTFFDIGASEFTEMMNVNVGSVFNVTQIVAEKMIKEGIAGSILNISSVGAEVMHRRTCLYSLTKSTVDSLTKMLALELGPHNIRVNGVNPAGIKTEMLDELWSAFGSAVGVGPEVISTAMSQKAALGRVEIEMDEFLNTALFLLSPMTPMVHGESLFIDGGLRLGLLGGR